MTSTIILAIVCAAQSVAIALLAPSWYRERRLRRTWAQFCDVVGSAVVVQPAMTCGCDECEERRVRKEGMVS